MVVFDATTLLFVVSPDVLAPRDPATGKPIERAKDRVDYLLKRLQRDGTKIIIPTPVLGELFVRAKGAAPGYLAKFRTSASFRIAPFDERAAIQVSIMAGSGKPERVPAIIPAASIETYAKLKYDRQIVAIAKVEGATAIYSDDEGVQKQGKKLGLMVVPLWQLPLPPDPAETEPTLLDVMQGDSNAQTDKTEASEASQGAEGKPAANPEVSAVGPGDGVQPGSGTVRKDAEPSSAPAPQATQGLTETPTKPTAGPP